MGARNVSAAFAMYPDLAPLPKLLLVWMALKSLDSASKDGRPPRVYFDGEQSLIEAGGRSRRQVYEGLKVLREAGAVEVLQAGRLKYRAVYKLHLDPLAAPSSVRKTAPKSVRETAPNRVRKTANEGAENRTPKKYVGGTEEITERNNPPHGTNLSAPVDNSGHEEIDAEMTTEQAHRTLIDRHGTRVHDVIAQHQRQCDCPDPVRHLLATPQLRVIEGGAA
ncbi:hypothetical protein GCM10027059_26760 [Myceligenerans halotolerans]